MEPLDIIYHTLTDKNLNNDFCPKIIFMLDDIFKFCEIIITVNEEIKYAMTISNPHKINDNIKNLLSLLRCLRGSNGEEYNIFNEKCELILKIYIKE